MSRFCVRWLGVVVVLAAGEVAAEPTRPADGYRGLWTRVPGSESGGGRATAPTENGPIACYVEQAGKTFFVYAGAAGEPNGEPAVAQAAIGWFDHKTGKAGRPRILLEPTEGMIGAPALTVDAQGYLWVFIEGPGGACEVLRSGTPLEIDTFERVTTLRLAHPQVWSVDGQGLAVFHNVPGEEDRSPLAFTSSKDGRTWTKPVVLADIEHGVRGVSGRFRGRLAVAFSIVDEESRTTNVYYLESADFVRTWTNAGKQPVELPLRTIENPALTFDWKTGRQLVYVTDLTFDAFGNPTIVYLTSSALSGPAIRMWATSRWTGRECQITRVLRARSNADVACLYYEPRNEWRFFAPTGTGAEPDGAGGEVVMWTSADLGRAWLSQPVTRGSRMNHNHIRRVIDARPEFYALWCDGAVRKPSTSRLYFVTKNGEAFRLPAEVKDDTASPEKVELPPPPGTRPASRAASAPASRPSDQR